MTDLQHYQQRLGQLQTSLDRANGEIERLNDRIDQAMEWLESQSADAVMAARILRGEADENRS